MVGWNKVKGVLAMLCLLVSAAGSAAPRTILFVGNSFTYGALSPVRYFHPERVSDLNGEGIGGVPALFKTFTDEAGLDFGVSLETSPGKPLSFHLDEKRALIAQPWDVMILQGHSLLDPDHPGDATRHAAAAQALARIAHMANPRAEVDLVSTWSRADQTYLATGHWYGKPIEVMAADLAAASREAVAAAPRDLHEMIPVGTAWTRAIREGLADPDPYDGLTFGKIDLWAYDQYHASTAGYYLEALVLFGAVTGIDPRTLGDREAAAEQLGVPPSTARALQTVAWEELAAR